jgi:hypothetical protein
MTNPMNGAPITQVGETIFIPLPAAISRPIPGGCQCFYCKAHPDQTPTWDTLAVSPGTQYAWTVHYPEIAGRTP